MTAGNYGIPSSPLPDGARWIVVTGQLGGAAEADVPIEVSRKGS